MGVVLSSCGSPSPTKASPSSPGSSTKPTQKTTSSPSPTASAPPPTQAQGGSGGVSNLGQLASRIQDQSQRTFRLQYLSSSGSGSQTVTLEQMPPKQLFKVSGGEVISDGAKTYFCNTNSSPPACMSSTSVSNPFSGMMAAYSGTRYAEAMRSWQAEVASGVAGYHLSFSHASFAGQSSTCVNWTYQSSAAKYCITDSGVLAYVGEGSTSMKLVSYSHSVSASDFVLPRGAMIEGG